MYIKCSRCKKHLEQLDMSLSPNSLTFGTLPTLYNGVICTKCGRIECGKCKAGNKFDPCSWCEGEVTPGYEDAIFKYKPLDQPSTTKKVFRYAIFFLTIFIAILVITNIIKSLNEKAAFKENEQKLLAKEATSYDNATLRKEAVEKLEPAKWKELLIKISKSDKDITVRISAYWRLGDQKAIALIAKNKKHTKDVRIISIEKLKDKDLLADLAKNDEELDVSDKAYLKLYNLLLDYPRKLIIDVAYDVAKNAKHSLVRLRALEDCLPREDLLADVAKNERKSLVGRYAISVMKDQKLLADIAKNAGLYEVRIAAVEKLTDQEVLADIAKNDQKIEVREAVERRLWELRKR